MKSIYKKLLSAFIILELIVCLISSCSAQEGGQDILGNSLVDIYTVAAVGVGGAVLGLSTLSFADKPNKHIKNIWIGASIGLIIGVGIVAWSQATESQGTYNENAYMKAYGKRKGFDTYSRQEWHVHEQEKIRRKIKKEAPLVVGSFSF